MALSLKCCVMRGMSKKICGNPPFTWCQRNYFGSLFRCLGHRRMLSSETNSTSPTYPNPNSPSVDTEQSFITIYKMRYIRLLSLINSIKLQQTVVASVAVPVASILSYTGHVPVGSGWVVGALSFLACSPLYMIGFFTTNIVGFVYVTPDCSIVRIAYVDSWGRRRDEEFPAHDLVPLTELERSYLESVYYKLQRYTKLQRGGLYRLHLSRQAAEILDQDRFTNVFGKVYM